MATGDDPADQWVFDPETGDYRLRRDGDPAEPGPSPAPPPPPAPAPAPPEGGRAARRKQQQSRGRGRGAATTGRRRPPRRRNRALMWTAGSLGFVLVAGSVGGYLVYKHFNDNINSVDVHPGGNRSDDADGPMNILILGTDSRQGLGRKYGDAGSVGHADTTILLHVAKDRSNATAVSIPRDLQTDIPECQTGSKMIPGTPNTSFNTSLGQDGRDPGCTWKTTEQLMGIRINHFMMVNFDAVKTLSTAVGGVEVCAGKNIDDPKSHLHMTAGRHVVEGDQALAFVRTRHAVGLGGDLTRIPLQQQFMSSLVRKIKSDGTLSSPTKLWDLADAATKALTVDSGIGSINKLKNLAQDIGRVDTKNITFTTVPVIDDPQDKNKVVLKPGEADQLFKMVQDDTSLTAVKKKQKAAKDKARGAVEKVKKAQAAPASEVRVSVVNGSGVPGQAQTTINWLQNDKGYRLSSNGMNAPKALAKTQLVYAEGQEAQAKTLVKDFGLPDSALKPTGKPAKYRQQVVLTLGKDFTQPGTPVAAPTKAPSDLQRVQANDKNVCAK